jgi:hypothetical protein
MVGQSAFEHRAMGYFTLRCIICRSCYKIHASQLWSLVRGDHKEESLLDQETLWWWKGAQFSSRAQPRLT